MPDYRLVLKAGREKSLLRRHPWVFSGAVAQVQGEPPAGETLQVVDDSGHFLAWAAYSPQSQITARVWSWDQADQITPEFLGGRLRRAIALRADTAGAQGACRLVNAESDGLPGLIVDRYAGVCVAQFLSCGVERWREALADALLELSGARVVYERSDADVRSLEGLPLRKGVLRGEMPAARLEIEENGLRFFVDVVNGHKTGHYLDQRRNREIVGRLGRGRTVLDCFCYTGGFAVHALAGGAAGVLAVEASPDALEAARENVTMNGLPEAGVTWQAGDVFQALRGLRDRNRHFDLIVLDPPKFAASAAQVEGAARGYKDINLLAFKLLSPGGYLVTFSCSGGVSSELFQKIVAGAALDAGVEAQIHTHLQQSEDHPVALNFPEGAYLKGLVIKRP